MTERPAQFMGESSSRFNLRKRRVSLSMLLLKSTHSRLKIQVQSWEEQDKKDEIMRRVQLELAELAKIMHCIEGNLVSQGNEVSSDF